MDLRRRFMSRRHRKLPDTLVWVSVNHAPTCSQIIVSMGRVRKHRRIKSCDPLYRGPKTDLDKGFNLPPKSGSSSQSSRSFRDFLLFTQTPSAAVVKQAKSADHDKDESADSVKLKRKTRREHSVSDDEQESSLEFKRAKGESTHHYLMRVDFETNKRLLSAQKKFIRTSTKRKEYLKKRKLKSKLRKKGIRLDDAEGLDFEDLQDFVKFGEVVQAPPTLTTTTVKKKHDLLLSEKFQCQPSRVKEVNSLKKQQDLAEEREKVISIYRQAKLNKRTSKMNS